MKKINKYHLITTFALAFVIGLFLMPGFVNAFNGPSANPPTGNGAVSVATDGKVGIGTATPAGLLHMWSNGDTDLIVESDADNSGEDDNARLILRQDGNLVNGIFGTMGSTAQYSGAVANAVFLEAKDSGGGSPLQFVTGGTTIGGTNGTARMTILQNGNVGIGTTAPGAFKLNVNGNTNITGNLTITGTCTGCEAGDRAILLPTLAEVQYNGIGTYDNDGLAVSIIDPVGGASCTAYALTLTRAVGQSTGFSSTVSTIKPVVGKNIHIKTDSYVKVDTSVLRNPGCSAGNYKHGGMIAGFTDDIGLDANFPATNSANSFNAVGFQYDAGDNTIYAFVHNGTGFTRTATAYTVSTTGARRTYEVVIRGTTSADFYVDGTLATTITTTIPAVKMTPIFAGLGNQTSAVGNTNTVYSAELWTD